MSLESARAHSEYTRGREDNINDRASKKPKRKATIDPSFKESIKKYTKEDPEWQAKELRKKSQRSLFIHQQVPSGMQL